MIIIMMVILIMYPFGWTTRMHCLGRLFMLIKNGNDHKNADNNNNNSVQIRQDHEDELPWRRCYEWTIIIRRSILIMDKNDNNTLPGS